jgi:hypothetical protein
MPLFYRSYLRHNGAFGGPLVETPAAASPLAAQGAGAHHSDLHNTAAHTHSLIFGHAFIYYRKCVVD